LKRAHKLNTAAISITQVSDKFSVSPQLTANQMQQVAALGFRAVINNRPDGEAGPEQPTHQSMSEAAAAAGLAYAYLPVAPSLHSPEQVQAMKAALAQLPQPVLAFCRSGARSRKLYEAALVLSDAS
jgi:uncharacterized protein (TIGR01244 family)